MHKIITILFLTFSLITAKAQRYDTVIVVRYDTTYVLHNDSISIGNSSALSLLNEIDDIQKSEKPLPNPKKIKVYNTFGGTHLLNGQTIETINKKTKPVTNNQNQA